MAKAHDHISQPEIPVKDTTLYNKALDIYTLSRSITSYLTDNKTVNALYTSDNESENTLEEIVISAVTLPSKIAIAQTTKNIRLRLDSTNSIIHHIDKIRANCKKLRKISKRNREHMRILSSEALKFKKMYRQWNIAITQQN
ncbi:hypothetical protein [uncultured Dokdonia sp.]|uniref:hypothetical protein n=1 Tax=uncultured Dokdonia sp. TaxID=575653 RepID=UPI002616FD21|nr:hypothetical protein [uncultured Dokdonia sp.]